MRAHVLLVEDSDDLAVIASAALDRVALVTRVRSDDAALAMLGAVLPDAVVTDLRGVTAGTSPVDYVASMRVRLDAAAARVRTRPPPIVIVSALDPDAQHAIARSLVGVHALPKPYGPRALRELVEQLTAPRVGAHPDG